MKLLLSKPTMIGDINLNMLEYKRIRSEFWIRIYENEDSITICACEMCKKLIDVLFVNLVNASPNGWNYKYSSGMEYYTLWFPQKYWIQDMYKQFLNWTDLCNRRIWLRLNSNTHQHFTDELDYCIACDWNFDMDKQERTELGKAEYNLKYHKCNNQEECEYYINMIEAHLLDTVRLLPIDNNTIITTIPSTEENQNKLSYIIAEFLADSLDLPFLKITLNEGKKQTKSLSIIEKIEMWNNIYSKSNFSIPYSICGNNILIADDLYQSGTSMWMYARYLKHKGAESVNGITIVKSMRDSDNS